MNGCKVCACYSVLNEEDYIKYSIDSVYDYVEKVIIVFGVPWSGFFVERDSTKEILEEYNDKDNKFFIQETNSKSEVEQRSRCLEIAKDLGMDYYWLVDGDEVYERKGVELIRRFLVGHPDIDCFRSFWYTYWRSLFYVIDPIEGCTPIIMRITTDLSFKGFREPVGVRSNYVFQRDENMVHHFSYAKSPKKIKEKIATFSHSHQVLPGWFEQVFLKWEEDRGMTDLHPVWRSQYKRAVRIGLEKLPEVMRTHPFVGVDVIR